MDVFIPIGKIGAGKSCYYGGPRYNIIQVWIIDSQYKPAKDIRGFYVEGVCNMISDNIYLLWPWFQSKLHHLKL